MRSEDEIKQMIKDEEKKARYHERAGNINMSLKYGHAARMLRLALGEEKAKKKEGE